MRVHEVADQHRWDEFVSARGPRSGAFLHSWAWGEFERASGSDVRCFGFFDGDELRGVAAFAVKRLPLGWRYLFCPRGPILSGRGFDDPEALIALAEAAGQTTGAVFLRFEPPVEGAPRVEGADLVPTRAVDPATTLILDLSPSEDQLLLSMHHKTRYNIRLAERKGVTVEFWPAEKFDKAWPLFLDTASRDRFRLHAKSHYQRLIDVGTAFRSSAIADGLKIVPTSDVFLAVALYGEAILAANLMVDFAGTRTYLHGASSAKYREFMGPHLLHWRMIQDARAKGLKRYDWWGIAGSDDPADPWFGITRFKKGFGGEIVRYPGTYDLVLDRTRYRLYTGAREWTRAARKRFRL